VKDLNSGDRVVVNGLLPLLEGEAGTVTNPDYLDHVIVDLDNEELRKNYISCFLPEELEKQLNG
jgi:hypothetical protein